MKTLLIDCGATKADWTVSDGTSFRTEGFNLAQTPRETLRTILDAAAGRIGGGIGRVYFYAAGLVGASPVNLEEWFPGARVEYASDLVAAARAVCGREPGIAAIVGTGANTCQWDGEKISRQIPCGGYILGDEGSAAVLGRLFVQDYLKGLAPEDLSRDFRERFDASYPALVRSVYGAAAPARFLGSIAPLVLARYSSSEYAKDLIDNNFRQFFQRTVCRYDTSLPLGVVGGFAHSCKDILLDIGAAYGIRFSRILPSPEEGLKQYHAL